MGISGIEVGRDVLVTTNGWFVAPNGRQYKSVFGRFNGVFTDEQTLGIKTNRNSTNWYAKIGKMVIAGCQIYYVIESDKVNLDFIPENVSLHDGERVAYKTTGSLIYYAGS